jgi:hypothetical protein
MGWPWAMLHIELTPEALERIRLRRKYDQQQIIAAIEMKLRHEPAQATRDGKRLGPNTLPGWDSRAEAFRAVSVVRKKEVSVRSWDKRMGMAKTQN